MAASDALTSASRITSAGLAQQQQDLPSLTGEVAEPALAHVPDSLTINQAVQRAIQWHPDIAQAVGKMLEQANQVDVAKAKYYPQISGGMNNGYSNAYTEKGSAHRLYYRFHRCCMTLAKSAVRCDPLKLAWRWNKPTCW
jgi:hypothetical protein